jgi:hypothetical protein
MIPNGEESKNPNDISAKFGGFEGQENFDTAQIVEEDEQT